MFDYENIIEYFREYNFNKIIINIFILMFVFILLGNCFRNKENNCFFKKFFNLFYNFLLIRVSNYFLIVIKWVRFNCLNEFNSVLNFMGY